MKRILLGILVLGLSVSWGQQALGRMSPAQLSEYGKKQTKLEGHRFSDSPRYDADAAMGSAGQKAVVLPGDMIVPLVRNGYDREFRVRTIVNFVNTSDQEATLRIDTFDRAGKPIAMPYTDVWTGGYYGNFEYLTGTLPPKGTAVAMTYAEGDLEVAWAKIRSNPEDSIRVEMWTLHDKGDVWFSTLILPGRNTANDHFLLASASDDDQLTLSLLNVASSSVQATIQAWSGDGEPLCRAALTIPKEAMPTVPPRALNRCFADIRGSYVLQIESNRNGLLPALFGWTDDQNMIVVYPTPPAVR